MVAGLARCESAYVGSGIDMPFAADALVHVLSAVAGQPAADAWVPVDGGSAAMVVRRVPKFGAGNGRGEL